MVSNPSLLSYLTTSLPFYPSCDSVNIVTFLSGAPCYCNLFVVYGNLGLFLFLLSVVEGGGGVGWTCLLKDGFSTN